MRIVIFGSMTSASKMVDVEKVLIKNGHEVILPKHAKEYASNILSEETSQESTKNKIE